MRLAKLKGPKVTGCRLKERETIDVNRPLSYRVPAERQRDVGKLICPYVTVCRLKDRESREAKMFVCYWVPGES
jgi:hypothetical protein